MSDRDQRLPKSEIIRRREDFRALFQGGSRWEGVYLRIHYLPADGRHVGFSVPKRFGNAVQRNRIKRLMREVYRKHRWCFGDYSIIIFARGRARQADYGLIRQEFEAFLQELGATKTA